MSMWPQTFEQSLFRDRMKVITCSMGGNISNVDFLRPIINKLGMELITISEWPEHDIKWQRDTWLTELSKADIVICAQRDIQPAKGNNRVTQAQYLGLPVCASPLQAYKEAITHGENGFICNTIEEWEECLLMLRDDDALRQRIGRNAKKSATEQYSLDAMGNRWLNLFKSLCLQASNPPKVDIIIPTYNNFKYLRACVDSIRKNTDWPYNIIVVNSGTDETANWIMRQNDIIYHNSPTRLCFSQANNIGLQIAKEGYVCFLNDDTIVAENWLPALMHEAMKPGVGGVNPFSNCDIGWLHNEPINIGGVELRAGMKYEEIENIIPQLYKYQHPKVVTNRKWLAFFSTVIPRHVINRVGLLDENLKSNAEDLDYCIRIEQLGYRFVTTFDSFVFHFGGVSRGDIKNQAMCQPEDADSKIVLATKYPQLFAVPVEQTVARKKVAIYTGQGWEKWSGDNVNTGIGGSETAAVYVAREFARRGFDTTVYGDPPQEREYDGVKYLNHARFDPSQYNDIFISSRRADIFNNGVNARKKVCWVHDIFLAYDQNTNINIDKIDRFFVLSPWHQQFFCNHHRVPIEKTYITRNGIDLTRFNGIQVKAKKLQRVPGRMIYSSSPDRGLDVLLNCLPHIQARVPEAHLKVFYGFDNWRKAALIRNNRDEINSMNLMLDKLAYLKGVDYIGRVGQDVLAEEMLQSSLWGYPTAFTETHCITAVEMMAAGVPIVTTNLAALSTTVGDTGIMIDGNNWTVEYQQIFIDRCVEVLTNQNLWNDLSNRGLQKASQWRWDTLVDEWLRYLDSI